MKLIQLTLAITLVCACVYAQGGGGGGGGGGGPPGPPPDPPAPTCEVDIVCGVTANTSDTVVTINNNEVRRITTTGCPGYDWTDESTPNTPVTTCDEYDMLIDPILRDVPQWVGLTNPVLDAIGVSKNGIAIFGPADGGGEDAYINEASTFDSCAGHPNPDGVYHYHGYSDCVVNETAGEHSSLFGFMLDGIPIYGPNGDGGVPPSDLDDCGGHTDSTHAFYHYHMQTDYPYTVDCLMGCVIDGGYNLVPDCTNVSETQYDYSSLHEVWGGELTPTTTPTTTTTSTPLTTLTTTLTNSLTSTSVSESESGVFVSNVETSDVVVLDTTDSTTGEVVYLTTEVSPSVTATPWGTSDESREGDGSYTGTTTLATSSTIASGAVGVQCSSIATVAGVVAAAVVLAL